jgi:tetratricopeptide (TPR) repeat protein
VLYPHSVAILHHLIEDYEAKGAEGVAAEIRARLLRDYPDFGVRVLKVERDRALARRDWRAAAGLQERVEGLLRAGGDEASLAEERGVSLGLRYQRAVAALEEERAEDAITVFEDLERSEPGFVPARIMLGEAELERGREDAALAAWRRGYEQLGSPVFLQRIEDHFIEGADPERAIATFRGLVQTAKNDLLPRFFLGRLYHRLELHEEALRVLEGIGDRIHSSPTYHLVIGRIHQRRGDLQKATQSFLRSIEELGLLNADLVCKVCREHYREWVDRCERCGTWNSVELDFEEERVSARELGVIDVPVWGGYEDSGEWAVAELRSKH